MIVLGGMIGVGLFMGLFSMIEWIGLFVLFVYVIFGIFIFFIMCVMGEMFYVELSIGLFVIFGYKYIYLLVGYMMVWSNWF